MQTLASAVQTPDMPALSKAAGKGLPLSKSILTSITMRVFSQLQSFLSDIPHSVFYALAEVSIASVFRRLARQNDSLLSLKADLVKGIILSSCMDFRTPSLSMSSTNSCSSRSSSPEPHMDDSDFSPIISKREFLLAQIRQKDSIIESLLKQVRPVPRCVVICALICS